MKTHFLKKSSKIDDFWSKIDQKMAKKPPFFTKNALFLHFFAKKKHVGVDPLFLQNSRVPPRHTLLTKMYFFRELVLIEGFQYKTQKNKIKKKFFLFFLFVKNIFFKKIFLRKVSLRRVTNFVGHLEQFSPRIVTSDIRSSPKGQRPFTHILKFLINHTPFEALIPRSVDRLKLP
jgi:hypothetical protein